MKIALLLQDKGIDQMDLSDVSGGNPGLGGTEYLFVQLCMYLDMYGNGTEVTVYHFNHNKLPKCNDVIVTSEEEAFTKALEAGEDVFILKNLQSDATYELMDQYDLKFVMWCHNFLTYSEMKHFSKAKNIVRVIAVGRQMYDYYIDEPVIRKMDYVFNYFIPPEKNLLRKEDYDLNVTYVGSLIYQKSFHVLAAAWKRIVSQVPEATLHVIGTGKLYNRENKLGSLGVAEESYEEMFLEHLRDEDGKLMDSVIFHGLMGDDKFKIYENTAVGVVNPLASTETFCLCAVEMESVGIPVVSRKKNGLLDTIIHNKTGLLYDDIEMLADYVIGLLKNRALNERLGEGAREFSSTAFLPKDVTAKWLQVFDEVKSGTKAKYHKPCDHMYNNGKRLRRLLHGIHRCPLLRWVPSIHDIQKK